MTDASTDGRDDLIAWRNSQPKNAYKSDTHFRNVIEHYGMSPALEKDLMRFGAEVAGPVDALVQENNLHINLPRLERFNGVGERIEKIVHHPTYHDAGRYIYGSGVMEAYSRHPNSIGALARFYVSSYNGEAGHNCPLACTAGVIRVLQEIGSDEHRQRFMQRFLDRDYDRHYEGAQFLTEVQGGSDVGANASRATQEPDGTWKISGEKWFCSNIDADVFLMTARPDGADGGTRGLGLFLVPRNTEIGKVNHFKVRRLKDKLGTRSMASGEVDFEGAVGFHMGEIGEGFQNMMKLVINTSRVFNAVGCAGVSRRAFVVAQTYAKHRRAFGSAVIRYPLMAEHLADMRAELDLMVSGTFHLVALQDKLDSNKANETETKFHRFAVNLNKVRTAKTARWMTVQGIEVLGGNGTIESFSVLPRLLRDSIVYENWEGTHNTLIMQIYRDCKRYGLHDSFFDYLKELIGLPGICPKHGTELKTLVSKLQTRLKGILDQDDTMAPLLLRPWLDEVCYALYAAVRLNEIASGAGDSELDTQIVEHFFELRLRSERTRDEAYMTRIVAISNA